MAVKLPDLGQMVGPLPLGAWIGITAGGLGLAYVANRGRGGKPAEEPSAPQFHYPSTPITSGPTNLNPIPSTPNVMPITENGEWIRAAIPRLVSQGVSPIKAQQCLSAYVEGAIPTGDPNGCSKIIDAAIIAVGPAPMAPVNQFPLTKPAPVKPPTVPQPAGRTPVLYWFGSAVYLTDAVRRTQWGLTPAEVARYKKRYRLVGTWPHSPGGRVPGYGVLHDSLATVRHSTDIAPLP